MYASAIAREPSMLEAQVALYARVERQVTGAYALLREGAMEYLFFSKSGAKRKAKEEARQERAKEKEARQREMKYHPSGGSKYAKKQRRPARDPLLESS